MRRCFAVQEGRFAVLVTSVRVSGGPGRWTSDVALLDRQAPSCRSRSMKSRATRSNSSNA